MASKRPTMVRMPSHKPKSRKVITLEMKLDILRRSERGVKISKIAREFSMATSTISTIIRNKEAIKKLEHLSLSSGGSCYITRGRDWLMEEMERVLSLWIEDENSQQRTPTVKSIREKARSIWTEVKSCRSKDVDGTREKIQYETFVASHGWYDRFRKRYNVNSGTINKNPVSRITTDGTAVIEIDASSSNVDGISDNEVNGIFDHVVSKNKADFWDNFLSNAKEMNNTYTNSQDLTQKNDSDFNIEPPSAPDVRSLGTIFSKVDEALRLIKEHDPEIERSLNVTRGVKQSIRCYRDLFVDVQGPSEPTIPCAFN